MSRLYKVPELLTPDHLVEFKRLCTWPSVTVDQLQKWLRDHGYKVSRGAVHTYRVHVRELASDPTLRIRACIRSRIDTMNADQLKALCDHLGGGVCVTAGKPGGV